MRCIVLGGAGFLASAVIRQLLSGGHEVHALVRPTSDRWRWTGLEVGAVQVHVGDLADLASLRRLLKELRPDVVFHLASVGVSRTSHAPQALFEGNVTVAHNVLLAAAEIEGCRIVYAASSLEQGRTSLPLRETDPVEPVSLFGAYKAAATSLMQSAGRLGKQPIVILRPFAIFGPREAWKRLIPTAIKAGLRGETLPLTGAGLVRDFIFVDDVARAFVTAAQAEGVEGEVFQIASGVPTSNEAVVALIAECLGAPILTDTGAFAARETDSQAWCGNPSKAQVRLGWSPKLTLEEGLGETVTWVRAQEGL